MNYEIKTNSLAKQLMLSVFFWYMLIAIILTTTHLVIEYAESKAKVEANIQIIAKTFSPSLAQSLWDVNFEQTNSAFLGMVEVRQVTGLKLASDTGELIASSGVTSVTEGFEQMSGIISYDFDISFQHKNKLIKVGQGTIYSNNQVVIEQLQEHLQYLIISALLKSLALWFLFLFMAKRQLHTPLTQLIKQIDFDKKNPYKTHPINLQLKRSNELTILENSFNDWQQTRTHYQEEISQHAKNLEITVQERTQQLEIAKQEAESSKNRADTANQYKTEFLAKTSHELRTPLNAIINLSHNLDSAQLQPPYSQQLNLIQRASDNLLVIINDILDISKIEAGNLSLQPSTLDLNKLIKNTIKTLEILADKKGLILNYTMPNNEPHFVYTDRSRLQQILVNLINNAIKFTQQGSVQLTVTIVATQEDSSLYQFDIIDTGVGIDKQHQGTIFDKFTRVHNSKTNNTEGSGLGLTICQQLTKLMGGKLYFKSEVDIGTTFTLQLPLQQAVCQLVEPASSPISHHELQKLNIFLAEDSDINRQVCEIFFAQESIPLHTTINGLELLHALENHSGDLIIMDLDMPVMDGLEATKRIRAGQAGEHNRKLPIIIVSAHPSSEREKLSLESGANAFTSKPIDFEKLYSLIANLCKVEFSSVNDASALKNITFTLQEQFLSEYLQEMQDALKQFNHFTENSDHQAIIALAHRLKSSSNILQQSNIVDCLTRIESTARNNSFEAVTTELIQLTEQVDKLTAP